MNKASIQKALAGIPDNTEVEIDATDTQFIHHDVLEIIEDFKINAEGRNISVKTIRLYKDLQEDPPQHFKLANGETL